LDSQRRVDFHFGVMAGLEEGQGGRGLLSHGVAYPAERGIALLCAGLIMPGKS
jgi:hypothetical protein